MSYLLHIESAIEGASICLSANSEIVDFSANAEQKESAGWMQVGIQQLIKKNDLHLHNINAISVSNGPGSYTGLRVGLATAKGLCYALGIPLITVNTLQMIAAASTHLSADLFCPMIDARRMEVYTAVFDKHWNKITPVHNRILESDSFAELLEENRIAFTGNGSTKFMSLVSHNNAVFHTEVYNAKHLVPLAFSAFQKQQYADLAYAEPCYGKAFYSPAAKSKLENPVKL